VRRIERIVGFVRRVGRKATAQIGGFGKLARIATVKKFGAKLEQRSLISLKTVPLEFVPSASEIAFVVGELTPRLAPPSEPQLEAGSKPGPDPQPGPELAEFATAPVFD
jgi:hypothetical protein